MSRARCSTRGDVPNRAVEGEWIWRVQYRLSETELLLFATRALRCTGRCVPFWRQREIRSWARPLNAAVAVVICWGASRSWDEDGSRMEGGETVDVCVCR
jgi:hypothetical protein